MLKKAVMSDMRPATRRCKCGVVGAIDPTTDKTYCGHCNELLFEEIGITSKVATLEEAPKAPVENEESLDESASDTTDDTSTEQTDPDFDFDESDTK